MEYPLERITIRPAASASHSNLSRLGRVLCGLSVLSVGASLAGVMAVAMAHEVLADDFFGVGVCGMVVVFGLQLARRGYDMTTGRQDTAIETDPLQWLWRSDRRVYLYRPYSHLEIRGR